MADQGRDVTSVKPRSLAIEEMLPMVREAAKRFILTLPREDICAHTVSAPSLKVFDDG